MSDWRTCTVVRDRDVRLWTQVFKQPGEVVCPDCWLIHPKGACDL